jgi:hypothetical protein
MWLHLLWTLLPHPPFTCTCFCVSLSLCVFIPPTTRCANSTRCSPLLPAAVTTLSPQDNILYSSVPVCLFFFNCLYSSDSSFCFLIFDRCDTIFRPPRLINYYLLGSTFIHLILINTTENWLYLMPIDKPGINVECIIDPIDQISFLFFVEWLPRLNGAHTCL